MNKINILGVNITNTSRKKIIKTIHQYLDENTSRYIVTPNPEIILKTAHDEELFYIINNADISLADGMGIKLAGLFFGKNIKRFTGSDLTNYLLEYSEKKGFKIVILNWRGGLSKKEEITEVLKKKYSKLSFYIQDIDREGKLIDFQAINKFSPDILFSTLGSPYQEKNIYHSREKIPSLKLSLAIGGSFDFITEKKIRAPKLFRLLGFEWLWRLIIQPNRAKRIFNAVFVFMWKFLIWRFVHPFLYRPNVACLLYRQNKSNTEIFMVERKDENGHWQIPQGGTDGESIDLAGKRELKEEIGTDKFVKIASYKNLHKYKFKPHYSSKFNTSAKELRGYKGQKQSLFIAKYHGKDEDIKIEFWEHSNWEWVNINKALDKVHKIRKEQLKIYLEKLNKHL